MKTMVELMTIWRAKPKHSREKRASHLGPSPSRASGYVSIRLRASTCLMNCLTGVSVAMVCLKSSGTNPGMRSTSTRGVDRG